MNSASSNLINAEVSAFLPLNSPVFLFSASATVSNLLLRYDEQVLRFSSDKSLPSARVISESVSPFAPFAISDSDRAFEAGENTNEPPLCAA